MKSNRRSFIASIAALFAAKPALSVVLKDQILTTAHGVFRNGDFTPWGKLTLHELYLYLPHKPPVFVPFCDRNINHGVSFFEVPSK